MKNRILHLALADLVVDPDNAADRVNEACRRRPHMRPTGVCLCQDVVLVPMEEVASDNERQYRFAVLGDNSLDHVDLTAIVNSRFFAGFSTLGAFDDGRNLWGFFARDPQPRRKDGGATAP